MRATDRRSFLKAGVTGLAGMASVPLLGSLAGCQLIPSRLAGAGTARRAISIEPLTERVRLVVGAPGNLVAFGAADGVVLVDSGATDTAAQVRAKVQGSFADAQVRTLINTHHHGDQTGGNALFGAAGAQIRAHTITKQWLATDYWVPAEMRWEKAPPKEAVPTATFREKGEMTAGNEHIEYGYLLEAHTRGDSYVYFRDSNVLVAGDVASPERDPVHDWFAGGWLGGRVDALDDLLELANDQTRIVPAYGPVMTRAELQAERDLMLKIFDRTAGLMAKGHGAQDMFDLGVHDEFERKFQDPFRFLYDLSKGYQAHYTNVGANVV
jgi:glyoxylase-like metal-dependent hydrolase (beta-lactamase superfamily II)